MSNTKSIAQGHLDEHEESDCAGPVELTAAQHVAAGLRELADFLDAHPELSGLNYAFQSVNLFPRSKEGVAAWARAAMRSTGKARKSQNETWAGVDLEFGAERPECYFGRPIKLAIRIERDEVCERVVTGTHEVTKEVPDAEALAAVPLVTVTETVEDVEWRCMPILAELPGGAS